MARAKKIERTPRLAEMLDHQVTSCNRHRSDVAGNVIGKQAAFGGEDA